MYVLCMLMFVCDIDIRYVVATFKVGICINLFFDLAN